MSILGWRYSTRGIIPKMSSGGPKLSSCDPEPPLTVPPDTGISVPFSCPSCHLGSDDTRVWGPWGSSPCCLVCFTSFQQHVYGQLHFILHLEDDVHSWFHHLNVHSLGLELDLHHPNLFLHFLCSCSSFFWRSSHWNDYDTNDTLTLRNKSTKLKGNQIRTQW